METVRYEGEAAVLLCLASVWSISQKLSLLAINTTALSQESEVNFLSPVISICFEYRHIQYKACVSFLPNMQPWETWLIHHENVSRTPM